MPDVVAFLGPSLPAAEVPPGVAVWPPARRGDVLRALAAGAHTLVVVDGYFHVVPAVTHQELVYALDGGARVLGAASMGALRAAELAALGMEPVGTVAGWYTSGALAGDDEVALLHAPAEDGYRALTVPLVEVRHALAWAPGGGAGGDAAALLAALAELPYAERDRGTVGRLAARHLGAAPAAALLERLARPGVKAADSAAALRRAVDGVAGPHPRQAGPGHLNGYLGVFLERHLGVAVGGREVSLAAAWAAARVLHPEVPQWLAAQRERWRRAAAPAAPAGGARALAERHLGGWGRPLLPPAEYAAEAALPPVRRHRAADPGGGDEARREAPAGEAWAELLAAAGAGAPSWWACRAFSLSPAFAAAAAVAAAADEVARCFAAWSGARAVARGELRRLAAELWGCAPAAVAAEGARRGLFPGDGLGIGLDGALRRLVVAERLPRPVNEYREARARLLATPLAPPTAAPAAAARGGIPC